MLPETLETDLTELLSENYLFSHLPEETLHQLAQRFEVITSKLGQTVVVEGGPGDAVFLVHSGKLRVVKQGPNGMPITLATLSAGEFLGEHALLEDEPRSATVRAAQDSLLFRLKREDFLELMETQPDLRVRFEQLITHRGLARFLQTSTIFHALPAREIGSLLDQFQWQRFDTSRNIIRQGDAGNCMYVLTAGDAKVVKVVGGEETILAYLGPGDYFGERALLQVEPRYASVIAISPVEAAVLKQGCFEKLLAAYPRIRERLAKQNADYAAREEAARKFGLREPTSSAQEKIHWETIDDDGELPRTQIGHDGRRGWIGLKRAYPFIPQEDETDCSAASLAMIARFYNVRLSIERLRDLAFVGPTGASGLGLVEAAKTIGFDCRAVNTDYRHLRNQQLPAIAHWKGYHFLVVYETKEKHLVIGDPAEGLVTMSREEFEESWTGGLFLMTPTEKLAQVVPSRSAWHWLHAMVAPNWLDLLIMAVLAVILAVGQSLMALFLQPAVDRVIGSGQTEWFNALGIATTIIAILLFVVALMRRLRLRRLLEHLHQRIAAGQADRLWQLPLRTYSSRQPGSYLQKFHETDSICNPDIAHSVSALFALALPAVATCYLASFHFTLPLLTCVLWLSALLHLALLTPPLMHRLRRLDISEIHNRTRWHNAVAGHSRIKKTATETRATEDFHRFLAVREQLARQQNKGIAWLLAFMVIIPILGTILGIALAAALTMREDLTLGQFTAVSALVMLSFLPLFRLVYSWPGLLRLCLLAQRQADFHDVKSERSLQKQNQTPRFQGKIFLQDVSYRHCPESREVLSHLHLNIEPEHFLWVVGRPGAGKTTLAQLLQGHIKPITGTIRFDGHDLLDIDLAHLRRNMHVVGEVPEIVAGSVCDNISLGSDHLHHDQIINGAKLANAHEFIMALPLGYETHIGPPGVQLSLSQQQQICIARAVLADPRVLILDDATALLDDETESAVLKKLRRYAAGRTMILMTRRKPEAIPIDEVVVLDAGRIVEKGLHSELILQRGLYSVIIHGSSEI